MRMSILGIALAAVGLLVAFYSKAAAQLGLPAVFGPAAFGLFIGVCIAGVGIFFIYYDCRSANNQNSM